MEFKNDISTKEDKDFMVDDGYNHDEDPTYEPKDSSSSDDDKYVVTGKEFKKLSKKAKKLGAESFDYSTRKNNKYVAALSNGKKIHFGKKSFSDYLIHQGEDKKEKYLSRAKKIKNRKGELTWENPESGNYWSTRLIWNGGK